MAYACAYINACCVSLALLILALTLALFCGAFSCFISSFSAVSSRINGLIALWTMAFISSILGILDIFPIGVAEITLGEDLVVEENTELPELARNSYSSSLSSRVFCRFCGIMGGSVASIYIEGAFDLSLICLFCLYGAFCVGVGVLSSNANSSASSVCSLFWLKIAIAEECLA